MLCHENMNVFRYLEEHHGRRRPSSSVDMISRSRSDGAKKCLVVRQSTALRLRLSAFQTCTWALVMQEDCLEMWTLDRGLDPSLPVAPEDGLWVWSLRVARLFPSLNC